MFELSKRSTSRWEVLLALGPLLELIPGESKFGPELVAVTEYIYKKKKETCYLRSHVRWERGAHSVSAHWRDSVFWVMKTDGCFPPSSFHWG